jgi:hypothetical protein
VNTEETGDLARLRRAQSKSNHDWVRMINDYWGRRVARVVLDPSFPSGDKIVSDQPWHRGFPHK